ncbi:hypothetical protein [Bacillus wiedmannii]|uniref:hypothetical protein n=1 Tax=Bacillus wiedmannii TaxID=1890302 RepID=UPI00027C1B25|nr:hypothetical protein [Bacillus wiedmannii]EJV58978.1 hypothetical protein IEO_04290 [Bacillus wiedmannii]MED3315265.1 hypothetical protein [Bacillus wiedmannii]OOR29702.1 hypothetical protein BW893_02805 [Bacillus wiedmannii]PEO14935.1 hypothetical protein CN546_20770 [Bacillus wiedmannii]PEU30594.1 hypothetical protein CN532_06330 [Bacillus wiedmannii]
MKKICMLFIFLLTASFLVIGCSAKKEKADMNLEKAQKVEIESLTDSSDKKVITDKKEIEKLFEVMKMDKWEMQSAPLDTPQGKTFKMYQEDTKKLSDSSNDKKGLHEIGTMTVYKDVSYVEVEMKNKKMSFKVPEDVAKDLLQY